MPSGSWVTLETGPARKVVYDSYVVEETTLRQVAEVETGTPLTDHE